VPALEALCGRLTGFGSIRVVPEQVRRSTRWLRSVGRNRLEPWRG
jgi:hypothetical protein